MKRLVFAVAALALAVLACGVATSNKPLYQDDFSDVNSGWPNDDTTYYADGGYVMSIAEADQDLWVLAGQSLPADVIVEVSASRRAGPEDNNYGIICRAKDLDNFYFFWISSDSYQVIGKYENGESSFLSSDQMQFTDGIKGGLNESNRIRAECVGNTLKLVVNGRTVAKVTDDTFTEGGDVGLMAGTFEEGGVEIFFDNLVVTKPAQ